MGLYLLVASLILFGMFAGEIEDWYWNRKFKALDEKYFPKNEKEEE